MRIETHVDHEIRGEHSVRFGDAQVAALAARQHGVVARWQLLERGMGRRAIDERLRLGRFHPLHRGAYAVGHRALSWEGRLMAAVLTCGPGAALSHRSAAQLWGLMPRRAIAIEVTRLRRLGGRAGVRTHASPLRPDEVGVRRGIPVTSVPRTLVDVAPQVDRRELERAWNEMEVRRLWDELPVEKVVARHSGRRGIAALRGVMYATKPEGRTRNELEERFVALVDDHCLPRPRVNAHLALRDRLFEVDALWDRERLAVELDGGAVHGTRRAFHRDRERDRVLLAEGYRTARVTWDQMRDEPFAVAADIRRILAR